MEKWKTIADFEVYEVSDLGNVRSVSYRGGPPRVLKTYISKKGHLELTLYRDAEPHTKKVHILDPLGLPEVNHLGPRNDCRETQLEWRSTRGNNLHAAQHGLKGDGVSYDRRRKKYRAGYAPSPRTWKHIGMFGTKAEALEARTLAVQSIPEVV